MPLDVNIAVFAETPRVVGYVRAEALWKAVSAHPELVRDLVTNMRRKTMGHRLATMGVIDLNRAHVTIKNRKRLARLTV